MKMYRFLVLAMLLVLGGGVARAQLVLDEVAARKNLVSETKPVMPKTEARAGGKVMLLVTISKDGRVTSAQADSGPSALRAAAVEAVKKWRFRPFTSHGDKVIVHTKLAVVFGEGAAEAKPRQEEAVVTAAPPAAQAVAAGDYAALAAKCHELVRANVDAPAEAKACRAAAAEAGKFAAGTHTAERRSAYIYAATALMRTNDLKAATTFGSRAVAVVKEGHDDNSGSSAAYAVRGQAEAFAGDLASGDRDLLIAEDFERRAIAGEAGKPLEPEYRAAMKSLLLFHAQLLKGMKRADDAAAKTAEAGKY